LSSHEPRERSLRRERRWRDLFEQSGRGLPERYVELQPHDHATAERLRQAGAHGALWHRGRPMSARKGFSLIEIMVAMTILSIVLMSLAKISTQLGIRARGNDIIAKRNAVLQLEANKLGAVPYATLATWSTSTQTLWAGPFQYTRRLGITQTGP